MTSIKKKKILFIGESPMLLNCLLHTIKFFNDIVVVTKDKKIKKEIPQKIIIKSNINKIDISQFDYLFSVMNKEIINKKILSNKNILCLNFHDAYLPEYAGIFTSTWSILNNENYHGATWHKITSELDRGDILLRKSFKIKKDDTAMMIDNSSTMIGFFLFKKIIDKINRNKKLTFSKQDKQKFKYYGSQHRLKIPNYGFINFEDKLNNIIKLNRALTFSPQKNKKVCKLKLFTNKGILIIKKMEFYENKTRYQNYNEIINIKNNYFVVKKKNKYVKIILENKIEKKIKIISFKEINLKKYLNYGLKYD